MTSGSTFDPSAAAPLTPPSSAEPVMLPASFAQELLWLTDRASPGSTAYNVPRARRLRGRLEVDALRRAFDALVARHEILRTTYATVDEQVVQAVHQPSPVPFELVDLSDRAPEAREDEAARVVQERSTRPFDLGRDLLLRVTLVRLDADDHVLLLSSHHIAFDGWSRDIVFRELTALYEAFVAGEEPALPVLPIQYADFAIWQREQLQGERLAELLGWWRRELGDAEHVLRLPTDVPRPASSRYEGITRTVILSPGDRDALRELGRRYDATPYMVILAAYATVLHRYTGQADVLVGSPIAGRAQPETESLIGYFANTIVQRARFAGDPTFGDLLRRLRDSALGAYDHQDVPFEKLVLELEGRPSEGQSPLFQVVFTQLDASSAPEARMGDVRLETFALETGSTKFDLTLFMADRPDGLHLSLRARSDLYRAASVERFLGHLRTVLEGAIAAPETRASALPLLTPMERAQVDAFSAAPAAALGAPATLVGLFEAQAARVPTRPAVVGPRPSATAQGSVAGTITLRYGELRAQASQLAHLLRAQGVGPDVPVGLLLDRSIEAMVGFWGILLAGGAVVPLSLDAPAARIARQVATAGVRALVTSAAQLDRVPAGVATIALDRDAAQLAAAAETPPTDTALTPEHRAYILFTSGSTGEPKGVVVTHANAVHYARAISRVFAGIAPDAPGDGFAALDGWHFGLISTLAADLGHTSLWPALLAGGTLHVLGRAEATEPVRFAAYTSVHPLDVLKLTPGHLRALVGDRTGAELSVVLPRRWTVLGGEALSIAFARRLLDAGAGHVLNHYGPTETTVGALTFQVTPSSLDAAAAQGARTVPLGRPLAGGRAFVADAHGQDLPIGIPGELLLGGPGVAVGYVGQPERTTERFVEHDGVRVYRTGDRVRWLADGALEFLGRADDQVKVRGFRVELDEIAARLRAHPAVAEAVVVLHGAADDDDTPTLVGYVVARQGGYAASHAERPTAESLGEWVAAELPPYMVPGAIVLLDALPRTANGKLDRAALPAPDAEGAAAAPAFEAPRTETERTLAAIWGEVLKREGIGRTDSFLELGGHSLLAIRVLGKISKAFGVRLPLRTLFDTPTIAQLGEVVELELKLAALESMSDEEAARLLAAGEQRPGGEG